jgi:hypothetical protein
MKDKMIAKWESVQRKHKLAALLVTQVWFWPQLFSVDMPPNVGIPLSVTTIGCIFYNVILWVNACDSNE